TQQSAWKHHPWDASATGEAKACKGICTYVFKGGVIYRGALKANESGAPGNPIRLTSDPSWGKGEGVFYGSTRLKGGWKKATAEEAPGIPKPESIWYVDVGKNYPAKFLAMWQVSGEKVERLIIAREPNYDLSDPNDPVKNWPTFSKYDAKTKTLTAPALKGLGDKDLLKGATIWAEGGFLMGAASPGSPGQAVYDPVSGTLSYKGWGFQLDHQWAKVQCVHFMLENVAKFLDAPGEYFFETNGPKAGRLFLWPCGGVDPNTVVLEVALFSFPLTLTDQHDIVVSGLEFRYNSPEGLMPREWTVGNGSPAPCIRVVGNCSNITVKNCKFYHVAAAFDAGPRHSIEGGPANEVLDNIRFTDNDIQHASRAETIAIYGGSQKKKGDPYAQLKHVEVLRNRVVDTGFRHGYCAWCSIPAIVVSMPETCEIAGNIVDTSFGNGIITFGGKGSGSCNVVPLTRMLVHHNQIDNTMLGCNDYGGLEHFQGGPIYLYNNITRNAVGNRTLGSELGYNLYLDGGFKCYAFNNIIAGLVKPNQPDYYNHCGYFMVFGFLDQLFNNTIYHFKNDIGGNSGNRSNILGNLMLDSQESFIGQNRPGDVSMMGGGDTGAMGRMGIPTMAYGSNVFHGNPKDFGCVAGVSSTGSYKGAPVIPGKTLEELRDKLQAEKCRLATLGWQAAEPPVVNPAQKDYRLTANSAAKGRGVKYFVPWALARNVGEWNFYKGTSNPQVVLGEGYYMTDEYLDRDMYYFIPRNDLIVSNCTAADYVAGPLEDWIEGALAFDGKERVATLSHAELTKNMEYPAGKAKVAYDGSKRETVDMGANNFLIEIVFKTEVGQAQGVLAAKLAQSGYELAVAPTGGVCLKLVSNGAQAAATSTVKVNDGKWHHVLAEADRVAGKASIYIDGKAAGEGKLDDLTKDAPLSSTADFIVGKSFAGAVDFLRVCRSTLAESKTTIDELYAWEFNGPFLGDFTGKVPANGKRDAGAMQFVPQ
ncbi:MAG: LamG-like jellyroll fold domain-containing protein, partial [Planctomycetota bacterium]